VSLSKPLFYPRDPEECQEPGCTNKTQVACTVELRGHLQGHTCDRRCCSEHRGILNGKWACASHVRHWAREHGIAAELPRMQKNGRAA